MIVRSSITKRLTVSVFLMELVAATALIAAVGVNEYLGQSNTLNANLRATANALLGAIQEGPHDDVRLELTGLKFPRGLKYTVLDESGHVLGSSGGLSEATSPPGSFRKSLVEGRSYRVYSVTGDKIIDPDRPASVRHRVSVLVALPEAFVWHEVGEALQFFTVCTLLLLGLTALLMVFIVRKQLAPIRALATAADEISPAQWKFEAPQSAGELSELRPLTEAIERTIARLQLSFEEQRRFTSDAAHELKTDLAIVKSSIQLLSMRKRSVSEYEQGLNDSLNDIARLEHTVQEMLALARLERTSGEELQLCRLDEALRDVLRQTETLAQLEAIHLKTPRIDEALVALDSHDANLLCSNIMLNALQHTPKDGVISVMLVTTGNEARVLIQDSGSGVNSEDAHLLFEPFYRSDPSRSRKSGSTGLGLSICKAICTRAGGTIYITNGSEVGAVVDVCLPIITAEPALIRSEGDLR